MIELTPHPLGLLIAVRARPGARKNAVLGAREGALRVAVSAAPEKGKANAAILGVIAEAIGCKPSQLSMISGETSLRKTVLVSGLSWNDLKKRIDPLVQSP